MSTLAVCALKGVASFNNQTTGRIGPLLVWVTIWAVLIGVEGVQTHQT
jgi:hypothetical protein